MDWNMLVVATLGVLSFCEVSGEGAWHPPFVEVLSVI